MSSDSMQEVAAAPPLRRFAGKWALWGLGVSVAIPGTLSAWNYGLDSGGFGGMIVATILVSTMYFCLCCSLAEMSAAMPFTGAGYAFARTAFGPFGGYFAGLAQTIEYVLVAAATVVSTGHPLQMLIRGATGFDCPDLVCWAALYGIFVAINVYGIELTCRVAIALAVLTLLVLGAFAVLALPEFAVDNALDVPVGGGGSRWLPNGLAGIALSIPFAVWFLVPVETLTLTPEEAVRPEKTLPNALIGALGTLVLSAFIVLGLNSAIPPGAATIGRSEQPLLLGFTSVLGDLDSAVPLLLVILVGYMAGVHATVYACGRSIFALARPGYLPRWLAKTHSRRATPYRALIVGGLIGFVAAGLVRLAPASYHVDAILIDIGVFSAIASYVIQMLAYLTLRRRLAGMKRPYESPLGATGAMTALLIAVAALIMMMRDPSYRLGLVGCVAVYIVGLLYYLLFLRTRIGISPEEAFAEHENRSAAHD